MCDSNKVPTVVDPSNLPAISIQGDQSARVVNVDDIARYNTLMKVSQQLAAGGLFPNANGAPGIFTIILYGHEMGLSPVTALNNIYIVSGRMGFSGQLIQSKLAKAGVATKIVESTDKTCSIEFSGKGDDYKYVETFSLDDANRAKLIKPGSNWEKYPKEMLYWRCLAKGGRRYAPESILGMYTVEELEEVQPVNTEVQQPRGTSPDVTNQALASVAKKVVVNNTVLNNDEVPLAQAETPIPAPQPDLNFMREKINEMNAEIERIANDKKDVARAVAANRWMETPYNAADPKQVQQTYESALAILGEDGTNATD